MPPSLIAELVNDYHIARAAVGDTRYERMLYAVRWFVKAHPEYSTGQAYKTLDRALA